MVQFSGSTIGDTNGYGSDRDTLLHFAGMTGQAELVNLLLDAKLDVNARDCAGQAPLHHARSVEIAKLLLDHGADINAKDMYGRTPISYADGGEVAEFLAGKGADLDFTSVLEMGRIKDAEAFLKRDPSLAKRTPFLGNCPMEDAINVGNIAMVRLLLDYVDVNQDLGRGETPLYLAATHGRLEIAQMLLERGAKVNARDNDGVTPVFCAADMDMVRLLFKHGAKVNAAAHVGSQLYRLAEYGRAAILRSLLDADPDSKSHVDTLLVGAANGAGGADPARKAETVRLLIELGANVNSRGAGDLHTPLHLAARAGYTEVVGVLLDMGAKPDAVDNLGRTPLHVAAEGNYKAVVDLLLSHGAAVNVRDAEGKMPLHLAAKHADIGLVRLLLEHKADAGARDKAGKLPWELADAEGQDEIAALLREAATK